MKELQQSGKATIDGLPREVTIVVKALADKHGGGILRSESHGLHLYIPCPECLKTNGTRELQAKHLAINIDKCFGLNTYKSYHRFTHKTANGVLRGNVALCHKTNKKWDIQTLINMPRLEDRGLVAVNKEVTYAASNAILLKDAKGSYIPYPPGECTPLSELPDNHPAIEYLLNRNYNIASLCHQFDASYCYQETPPDTRHTPEADKIGVYYRNMPDGWKDTPQGRIIFNADIRGSRKGWQARVLDKKEDGWKWYWHPYREEWVAVEKEVENGTWEVRADYKEERYQWGPSKYKMATGSDITRGVGRSSILMGYDVALQWNRENSKIPFAVLVEGPLDAGMVGPPAVAMLGKYLSDPQVTLLKAFKKIIVVLDNDEAGSTGVDRVRSALTEHHIKYVVCQVPSQYKDVGEMTHESAWRMLEPFTKDCLC